MDILDLLNKLSDITMTVGDVVQALIVFVGGIFVQKKKADSPKQ